MLLVESAPFDSDEHIYELKLDGIRCVAYLDSSGTELRNKRNKSLNAIYPELSSIHSRTNKRCILDGELVVLSDGKPDFYELQRRSLMTDSFRIGLSAKQKPVYFVAFDVLYEGERQITELSLLERKTFLNDIIKENESIAISRFIHHRGIEFYNLAVEKGLEGVVAKRKNSLYHMGTRTKNWVKFKKFQDSEFVICGFSPDEKGLKSIVLGAFNNGKLVYQGHVSLGIPKEVAQQILGQSIINCPFSDYQDNETKWINPELVCTVKYMMRTEGGFLRQPVFKGLVFDKSPEDCNI